MIDADLLGAALDYAARGWPVFPLHHPVLFGPKKVSEAGHACCSCRQPSCESPGKHPRTRHGLDDASIDPATITAWWTRWPEANIGLPTGMAFDVLDLDGPEALDALDGLAPPGGCHPILGRMAVTGRGIHIFMAVTGVGNRTNVGGALGVDWRGHGGYVVAPPSLHYLHGDRYGWGDLDEWGDHCGIDMPLAEVPTWLAVALHQRRKPPPPTMAGGRSSRYGLKALEGELGRITMAVEGGRNDQLNASAHALGQLLAGGELDAATVAGMLLATALRIGLTETEAVATIRSGMSAGMTTPRSAAKS